MLATEASVADAPLWRSMTQRQRQSKHAELSLIEEAMGAGPSLLALRFI
jgi:hypothetical protein